MNTGTMVTYEDVCRNANLHEGATLREMLERAAILEALGRVWPRRVAVTHGGMRATSTYAEVNAPAVRKLFERVTLYGAGRDALGRTWSQVADAWEGAQSRPGDAR